MDDLVWFGDKQTALFDVWSFACMLGGMSFFAVARWLVKRQHGGIALPVFTQYLPYVLIMSFMWEAASHYLELGEWAPAYVKDWFAGTEFWANRLIADPLLFVLGAKLVWHKRKWANYARVLGLVWLAVHIFYFEQSMGLQQLIF